MNRDFTYIDDIVDGTISAIEKNYKYEVFNLGNSKSENLMDMIKIIELELGKKAKIKFKPLQDGDMVSTFANINHTTEKISFKPKTDIKNGIPKLISWYKEYYNV